MSGTISIALEDLLQLRAEAVGFSLLPRQPVGSLLAGRHHSRLRGRGLSFEELRRYVAGDDIRTIDWRATARLRQPYVRVYNEERERPVLLVVDQRTPMFFGSQRAMKSVVAAELAALGAWRALSSGDRIGGIVFNDSEVVDLRPQRSQNHVLRLLHEVVRLNRLLPTSSVTSGPVSLNTALEAARRRAVHDYLVVLISDLDGADGETQRLATQIAAHNDMLVLAIYDPLGAQLLAFPGMVADDRGERITLPHQHSFAANFQRAFSELVQLWRSHFRALRVPVLPITTHESVAEQIRGLFGGGAEKSR
jgi:uncharacterized protein (DUF58 family)